MRREPPVKLIRMVFLVSLIIAAILGIADEQSKYYRYLLSLLVIGGCFTGFFLIGAEGRKNYLMAAFILIFIYYVGGNEILRKVALVGTLLSRIFDGIYHFIVSSTIVVCLKEMFDLYQSDQPGIFNIRK